MPKGAAAPSYEILSGGMCGARDWSLLRPVGEQAGGTSEIARSDACVATMRVSRKEELRFHYYLGCVRRAREKMMFSVPCPLQGYEADSQRQPAALFSHFRPLLFAFW